MKCARLAAIAAVTICLAACGGNNGNNGTNNGTAGSNNGTSGSNNGTSSGTNNGTGGTNNGTTAGTNNGTTGGTNNGVPECEGTCAAEASCVVDQGAGTATCVCDAGYAGDGLTCTDVDECADATDNCADNATCTNEAGSFSCACNPGFDGDGVTCDDIDECTAGTDDCGANAECANIPGGFTCTCAAGYVGDGVTCADIDECARGTDNCDAAAACTNVDGSFTCACGSGYVDTNGDGTDCTPENACQMALDNCDANAVCVDLNPGFSCTCPAGYTDTNGDGTLCTDVDECAADLDLCDENATCTNEDGGYICACDAPYVGDGFFCDAEEIIGALTEQDPGTFEDGTLAASCTEYRYPMAPYAYGDAGNGFYKIQPPNRAPIVVECDMDFDGGGWTIISAAKGAEFGVTMTDITNSGGCSMADDKPSGRAVGDLACRFDYDLGFEFDEVNHGRTTMFYTGLSNGDLNDAADPLHPTLGWVDKDWGTPYCGDPDFVGDLWWGVPGDASPGHSVALGLLTLIGQTPTSCAPTFQVTTMEFGPPAADSTFQVTRSSVLRFELGYTSAEDRGWEWTDGAVWVRDSALVP